jgi:TRAP-type C4-dicarboxylate transport system permease small subunit
MNLMRGLGAACLVGMTFLTCADVVGRFLRHPIFGSVEIVGFMATLAVALALPYTHHVKGHIGVEILVRRYSKRTQHVIDLVTGILSLVLFSIVTWRMAVYAHEMQLSGEVSMNLELPEYLVIYTVSFCFMVFALIIVHDIVHHIRHLRGE